MYNLAAHPSCLPGTSGISEAWEVPQQQLGVAAAAAAVAAAWAWGVVGGGPLKLQYFFGNNYSPLPEMKQSIYTYMYRNIVCLKLLCMYFWTCQISRLAFPGRLW